MKKTKKLWKWILSIFFLVPMLVYAPSFSSFLFLVLGLLCLPIAPVERIVQTFLKAKWLRAIIIVVLFFIGASLAPSNPSTTEPPPEPQVSVTDPIPGRPQITEPAIDQVTEAATEPNVIATAPLTIPETEPLISAPKPQNSTFEIHFIDVGQADAALVLCDGYAMLIDGGNVADSSRLYTYLKNNNISHLDYIIGTHAHEDHIGGLAGALNFASVDTAFCPVNSYETDAFDNFVHALEKHNVAITIPTAETTFSLGNASCEIIAVNTDNEPNNSSIVLRIKYGETSFLFTGDAEREVEQEILGHQQDIHSTLLKVGHHGSDTSTGYVWLREVMPEYAVISVGADNSYGHPTEEVLSRLRDADVKTFRTDLQGDIICTSDGSTVSIQVSKNPDADVFGGIGKNSTQQEPTEETETPTEEPTESAGTHYILNTNSKKFHEAGCGSAARISEKNRKDFYGTREELIAMGYSPCGNCDP